jgi:hypothetical protein
MAGARETNRLHIRWASDTTFAVVDESGACLLGGCSPGADVARIDSDWTGPRWLGSDHPRLSAGIRELYEFRDNGINLKQTSRVSRGRGGSLLLALETTNLSRFPVSVLRLIPLHGHGARLSAASGETVERGQPLNTDLGDASLWLHGRLMTADAITHRFGSGARHESFSGRFRRETGQETEWTSAGMVVIAGCQPARGLLVGFVTQARHWLRPARRRASCSIPASRSHPRR